MRAGQALILVLLLMSVIITVGLAISSRSVTDVGISTTQEESARALAAAEAGIEAALSGTLAAGGSSNVGSTGTYVVPAPTQYGDETQVIFDEGIQAGEEATVFLTGHKIDGSLDVDNTLNKQYRGPKVSVCWAEPGADQSSLEVILYYNDGSNYRTSRNIYDPVADQTADCPIGKTYLFKKIINFATAINGGGLGVDLGIGKIPLLLRLKLFYNGNNAQTMAVVSDGSYFPAQGQLVTSTGQAGQTSRRVRVTERYPEPLPYLDNAVFSGTGLNKN